MSLPTYCPQCRAVRQPNGSFCHMCGYSFLTKSAVEAPRFADIPTAATPRLSIADGFRFGIGFMAAVVIFSIITSLIWSWFIVGLLSALMSRIGS